MKDFREAAIDLMFRAVLGGYRADEKQIEDAIEVLRANGFAIVPIWQPTETAPRDGMTFLAYTADFCGGPAYNICIQEAKWSGRTPDDRAGHLQSRNGQIVLYWMPLPDPPGDKP